MRFATFLLVSMFACGGSADLSSDDADASRPPTPFVLQFSGTYLGSSTNLVLHTDGRYQLEPGGWGRVSASRRTSLPLVMHLGAHTAEVTAYDGALMLDGERLVLQRPKASDEELCDSSGGKWTDDDPDPKTGLYCVCPAGTAFIPAKNGCTRL
jgi:hypothetical protein